MTASPTRGVRLSLSDINILGAKRVNPHASGAEATSAEICARWGIRPPNLAAFITMSAYLFPRADEERLVDIVLLHNFLFVVDDAFDRHDPKMQAQLAAQRERNERFTSILAGRLEPDKTSKLEEVCHRLRERLLLRSNEAWLQRFAEAFRDHLLGVVHKGEPGQTPSLSDYMEMRHYDAGMQVTNDLIEYANNLYLEREVAQAPQVRDLDLACSLYASLTNDLFSYQKEVMSYGSTFNLIPVLQAHHQCGFEDAVHEAVLIINTRGADFHARADEVARLHPSAAMQARIEGLRDQCAATWHWQISTPRYRSPDSPFPELRCALREAS